MLGALQLLAAKTLVNPEAIFVPSSQALCTKMDAAMAGMSISKTVCHLLAFVVAPFLGLSLSRIKPLKIG